jgi:hypothetical protein
MHFIEEQQEPFHQPRLELALRLSKKNIVNLQDRDLLRDRLNQQLQQRLLFQQQQ